MPEQTFHDDVRQVLVRLTPDLLIYAPAGLPGWRCRVADIAWTSSRIGPRGVDEVRLHATDGHIGASIPEFEGIERFYLALLALLSARPNLDPIRDRLPSQVPRLERVLWLSQQTRDLGTWEAAHTDDEGVVAVVPEGIVRAGATGTHWERVPWSSLTGVRCRVQSEVVSETALRFYSTASHFDVPFSGDPAAVRAACERYSQLLREGGSEAAPYRILAVPCADADLAMTYSWELERAHADGLQLPGETVMACAFGTGSGAVVPGSAVVDSTDGLLLTELFLTDRRILQVDRDPVTLNLLDTVDLPVASLKLIRRMGATLLLGNLDLRTDTDQPFSIAADFLTRYRRLIRSQLNPFAEHTDLLGQTPEAAAAYPPVRDPFAPLAGDPVGAA